MKSFVAALLVTAISTGCATAHGPRNLDDVPPGAETIYDWTRVRLLVPPADIAVSTGRSRGAPRVFVMADDTGIVVLNLGGPTLPPSSTRMLRVMAVQHPEAFSTPAEFVQDDVRVGRDGVFVGDRKVATFEEVVERIARGDVLEVDGPVVTRGSAAGATLGGWLGFAIGVIPGLGGVDRAAAWPILTGSVVLGAYLGHRWSSHATDGIVYKAR
jgi:hypothetical protein